MPAETQAIRAIAKEAYLYGFPMVEAYKTLYAQAVEQGGPNYKAPFNHLGNTAKVFTPADTAIVTPNSDTPYSMMWMDLRAEPLVLTLPEIDPKRFYHVQLIDLFTHNFAYLGQRATGSLGGRFLIAGPGWKGGTPTGVQKMLHCETDLAYAIYRTQLFGPADIENVKRVQAGYKVQTLSQFLDKPAPPAAPPIAWPKPDLQAMTETPAIFRYMNLLLTFCPAHPTETAVLKRFASIGVGAGLPFDETAFAPEVKKAYEDGIADGVNEYEALKRTEVDTRKIGTPDLFGAREHLNNNYLYRYAAARLGIFGNSGEEAIYHVYFVDSSGAPLNGAQHRYAVTFGKGKLPPAKAFWSMTMYDGETQLLVDNVLNRYLINSPMLRQLETDADGALTLAVQHVAPPPDSGSNWLPAPAGPFFLVLRLYEPSPDAIAGTWEVPPLRAMS